MAKYGGLGVGARDRDNLGVPQRNGSDHPPQRNAQRATVELSWKFQSLHACHVLLKMATLIILCLIVFLPFLFNICMPFLPNVPIA